MSRILIFFSCSFFGAIFSYAQIDIPVDLLTGRPNVTIPLWQVSYGQVNATVSLYYSGGGVRTRDREGSAGMGWDLVAGGAVSREVRGLPDDYHGNPNDPLDYRRGWLQPITGYSTAGARIASFGSTSDDNLIVCSDEFTDWSFLSGLAHIIDPEPDLYSFAAPGLSGKFVFGSDGLPKLLPYQDLKLTVVRQSGTTPITSFEITKNDGIKYVFASIDKVTRRAVHAAANHPVSQGITNRELYKKTTTYTTAWKLIRMEAPNGEALVFFYGNAKQGHSKSYIEAIGTTGSSDKQYFFDDYTSVSQITQIKAHHQTVDVEWTNVAALVTKVKVTDNLQGTIKEFSLGYLSVRNSTDTQATGMRSFLKDIREQATSCNSFPAYAFEYYDVTPAPGFGTTSISFHDENIKQDLWGYFNDQAANRNPTIYYYSSKSGAERYRYYPIAGFPETPKTNGDPNRAVSPSKVMFGSLKKISYPTGGTATITYEPNQYYDAENNSSQYGPGVRVKKVALANNVSGAADTTTNYEYKLADGKSSGKWIYRSTFGYHDRNKLYAQLTDLSPEPQVFYERATLKRTGRGNTVYEYLLPGTYPLTAGTGSYADWSAAKTKVVRDLGTCASIGQLVNGYYVQPFAPSVNYDFERGLTSRVSDYNESGQLMHERAYTYQRLNTTSATVYGIRYEYLYDADLSNPQLTGSPVIVFSRYPVLTNASRVILTETERTADMNDPTKLIEATSTYTFSSTHHMLQYLARTSSDGKVYKTKYRYAKDFAGITQPLSTDVPAQMLKRLNDDFRQGTPVETINYVNAGSDVPYSAALTLFGSVCGKPMPVEQRSFNGTGSFSETTHTSGSNQTLTINSLYRSTAYFDEYNCLGVPVSVRNLQRFKGGTLMGFRSTVKNAELTNASAGEAVIDGFEETPYLRFDGLQNATFSTTAYAGLKGLQIPASGYIERTAISKAAGPYRYTLRIYGSASLRVSVYEGAVEKEFTTVTVSSANQWLLAEGSFTMSAVAGSEFKLRITNNDPLARTIDEVAFYPGSSPTSSYLSPTFIPYLDFGTASDYVLYDGFDNEANGCFDYPPLGLTYPTGWTGRRGVQVSSTSALERRNITKASGRYRYSLRIKAAAATTITFRVFEAATEKHTAAVSYTSSDINQWKYFEGYVPMNAVTGNTFILRVTSSGTATLDEVAFYPESSSISSYTYDLLHGMTSQTDTRGISSFVEYDELGRTKYLKDQDLNLLQTTDFYYKVQPFPALNPGFTINLFNYQIIVGSNVTFTAAPNCATPLTYGWYVNDVLQSTSATSFNYTFSTAQTYTIRRTVTHGTYGTISRTETYTPKVVLTGDIGVSVASSDGNYSYTFCDGPYTKTFNATLSGCYLTEEVVIDWYYDIGGGWVNVLTNFSAGTITSDGLSYTFNAINAFNGVNNMAPYAIRCSVRAICPTDPNLVEKSSSYDRYITYNGSTQCQ